ncbi:hypothetical protein BSPLISOX_586 [uncultured Gammaproteobacteria bacterium]|jgi:hypothetical protein|nr:hypothetical protein [uncultured Gammaproteobacteria bacterium]CAC9438493.1 hypothetical protein [uncultured Gammaproteobacteria bacterium]CAC9446058.1 hypothetical protein [uncultured Gammaproteobacteria bacterium]VVH65192.1 hypothetical protein BSPLISOX_586 [uncultured Gammaproteobacteria bacterium]
MDMQKTVFVDNFVIYTNINKMKYLKEQASTFVYGNLNIKAKSSGFKFDTFDLNCVQIKVNENNSNMLYIDSIASVLTRAFETKENIIDVDVYWSFNGDLEKENINNLSFNLSYFDEKKCVNTSYEDMFGKR